MIWKSMRARFVENFKLYNFGFYWKSEVFHHRTTYSWTWKEAISGKYWLWIWGRTYGKTEAESHIPDSVNSSIHRVVSLVNYCGKLGHHGTVNHADGKPQSSHGQHQLYWLYSKWNLDKSEVKKINLEFRAKKIRPLKIRS